MDSALAVHRLHFAFTVTFHYLFPQLTMGLALLIVILKTIALRTGNSSYNEAARFWVKIFAINFAVGVVTGIPMEFQFGTNWARFSRNAGGVIGQTLAIRRLFFFSRVELSGPFRFWREPAESPDALVLGLPGLSGFVAVGIFYHRDRRLDAAPGWLQGWAERSVYSEQ